MCIKPVSNDQNESVSIDMSVFFICCYKCISISLCTVKITSWEAEFLKSYIFNLQMWCWPVCISQLCGGSCEEGQAGEGAESTLCWSAWCLPTKRYELPREPLCRCEWTQHASLILTVPFAGQESNKESFLPADILIFWLMRENHLFFSLHR